MSNLMSFPSSVLVMPQENMPAHWGVRVRVWRGDITDLADVQRAAQGCSVIFHLAAARSTGAAVVLTTSICAYGDAIQRGLCQEDATPGAPQGPYSHAKQGQERLAWQFQAQGGRVCVVRPANIIGPGSGPWVLDAAQALRQGLPALVGGGQGVAGLTVVDNVADFLVLAAQHHRPGAAPSMFTTTPVTWRQCFEDLARVLGASQPRSVPRWLAYLGASLSEPVFRCLWPHQRPPVTREALNLIAWPNRFATQAARSLGWVPRVPYEQALQAIAQDMARRAL